MSEDTERTILTTRDVEAFHGSQYVVEIDPNIDSRLIALELLLSQQLSERMGVVEQKLAAVPAQLQQSLDAAQQAATYADSIRRMVIRGPIRGLWLRNIAGIGGLAAISTGLWWLCPASSLIVTGGLSLGLVVLGTLLAQNKTKKAK